MFRNNRLERKQTSGHWQVSKETVQHIEDDPNTLGRKLGSINPKVDNNPSIPRASEISATAGSQLSADSAGSDNGVDIPPLPPELTGGKHPPANHVNPQDDIMDCRRYPDFGFSNTPGRSSRFFQQYEDQCKRFNNAAGHRNHPDLEPEIPLGDDEYRPSYW